MSRLQIIRDLGTSCTISARLFRMSAHQMSPLTAVRGEKNFKKTVKYCKAKDAILIGLFRSLYLRNSLTVW